MQVKLAGFNVDSDVLLACIEQDESVDVLSALTPEVLSAAYARISRDPRSVGELRADAVKDVEAARKSNQNIVFGMGHASIAEHAQFNFDITGISRLAIEYLERHRLCSYTEKSQRYITLEKDFIRPTELIGPDFHDAFVGLVEQSQSLYQRFFPPLLGYFQTHKPNASRKLQEGWAKEDARYVSLMATSGQLGLTASARNLELIIRRCAASPLLEAQELGRKLYAEAHDVAPSLFRHMRETPYDAEREAELSISASLLWERYCRRDGWQGGARQSEEVCVCDEELRPGYRELQSDWDQRLIAAILYAVSPGKTWVQCLEVMALGYTDRESWMRTALRYMEFYDAAPREFEHVNFSFELTVSASCYAQLKRHRMCTQTPQPYAIELEPTIPQSIQSTGLRDEYLLHCNAAAELYKQIRASHSHHAAEYALTNGHKRRVLVTMNLRELYHFSRMRMDAHAQWDIRNIANKMVQKIRNISPLCASLLCGKDAFVEQVRYMYDGEWAKKKQAP